ncbi:hypothetical protein PHYSODRAFT_327811 [Phytophthora sojae]|uniref:Uncharacterized protein n=1 Tax=Phytophthora sojae (strain P6497) TaxID=1094619 RepID=G4Z7A5_PHYSP|nr:hypothetical protein PHYSODRAFT_327811 [Phytophthora sojae]EGZ19613.1 hypothetical protein PHYSODRAFT_327811 [Phytophthora sojae]|eukprot:XP_009522330.1 hypothetical protein PHYSODRAFT_327811 [Phytophthora sojae]
MRGHIAISQIVNMTESAPSDGKQATAPAQGTAPPGSAPPPMQQRTGDAHASTAPAGGGSGQTGNSASGATSTGSTKTGATKRVSFSSATGKTSDADMREAGGKASAHAATQETGDANSESKAPDAGGEASDVNMEGAPEFKTPRDAGGRQRAHLRRHASAGGGIMNDIRAGTFAMEGYGGASTLIGFEELSERGFSGVEGSLWRQRWDRRPVSTSFASFRIRRVFKMTGYLRRVLGAYRNMRSLADSQQGFTATQEVVDTRRKYKELKRAWKFTCDYWFLEVQEALGKVDDAESKYKVALGEQKARYQDEIDYLESEKAQLKARLADSEAQKFSDFLQEHTDFTGNWERLHDLFKLCIKYSKPPESWDTVINVTTMDKRKAAVAPYPEKSTRMPPSSGSGSSGRPEILDLTGPGSKPRSGSKTGGKTQDSKKSQGSKKGQGPRKSRDSKAPGESPRQSAHPKPHKVQRRPKDHQPCRDSVRRANEKTVVSKEAAHTMLPGGVVWKEVRPDVRQAILAGLKYDTAMEWIGSDRAAHGHFRQPQLIKMLVSMMYWRRLDLAPWSKYVLEAYYEMADERLARCLRRGDVPPPWGNLDDHMVYPDKDADSTVDDIENDPDYQPPAQEPEESASSNSSEEEEVVVAPETLEDIEDAEDDADAEDDNGVEEPLEVKPPAKRPRSESSKKPQGSNSMSKKKRRAGNKTDTSATQGSSGTQGELMTAEDPEDNETSWRIYGVLVQYPSVTKSASCQTSGFPEYEIHKYSYDGRFRVFYFHERELLSAKALRLMVDVVDAVYKHAQAIWERGHWVPIPTEEQADTTMESQRKSRQNALRRAYKTLVERSRNTPGFIPSLWHEPGLWKFPDMCCYWIWGDPRTKKLGGAKCKDLDVRLATLDIRERHIKPLAIRKLNPLSLKHSWESSITVSLWVSPEYQWVSVTPEC